jgi:hypothetical protein
MAREHYQINRYGDSQEKSLLDSITGENNFEFKGVQYPHHIRLSQPCQISLWAVKVIPERFKIAYWLC